MSFYVIGEEVDIILFKISSISGVCQSGYVNPIYIDKIVEFDIIRITCKDRILQLSGDFGYIFEDDNGNRLYHKYLGQQLVYGKKIDDYTFSFDDGRVGFSLNRYRSIVKRSHRKLKRSLCNQTKIFREGTMQKQLDFLKLVDNQLLEVNIVR